MTEDASQSPAAVLRLAAQRFRDKSAQGPVVLDPLVALAVAEVLEHRACEYDGLAEEGYGITGAWFVAGEYGGDADPFIVLARAYLGGEASP